MKIHNLYKANKRVFITLSFGVILALALLTWVGSRFVEGGEEQHLYIFATSIETQGWSNTESAYQQLLSPEAVVTDFSKDNTAYIEWGDVSQFSPSQRTAVSGSLGFDADKKPIDENAPAATTSNGTSTTTGVNNESNPQTGGGDTHATSSNATTTDNTTQSIQEEQNILLNATSTNDVTDSFQEDVDRSNTNVQDGVANTENSEEVDSDTQNNTSATTSTTTQARINTKQPRSPERKHMFEGLLFTYAHAQEATTSASTPALPKDVASTTTDAIEQSPFICDVTGDDCYTMLLNGFGVKNSLSENEIAHVSVQLSLATVAEEDVLSDDRIVVKYFLDDQWFLAGELTVEGVRANKDRGGYFEVHLPDVIEWSQLEDLQVAVEYVRNEETPAAVYLDAAWVDVRYRGLDEPTGQENVNDVLQVKDESRLQDVLVVGENQKLSFDYTDENVNESLILKTERASYEAHDGKTIYFNITNTSKQSDVFSLRFYTPQESNLGDVQLEKWYYNVPYEKEVPEYADTAYFCSDEWSAASSTNQYECAGSDELRVCDSLNAEGKNCIVEQEKIGIQHITEYHDEFKSVPVSWGDGIEHEQKREGKKLVPSAYNMAFASTQPQEIDPGQTLYFALDAKVQGVSEREMYIEAYGNAGGYGLLSPKRQYVSVFDTLNKHSQQDKTEENINQNVSFKKDLSPIDDLSFTFQYNSQQGFFSRLFRGGEAGDFKITRVSVVHDAGKRFEVAPEKVAYNSDGEWSVSLEDRRPDMIPGKYTLEIDAVENGEVYTEEKTFYWGVLAINTNKTIYTPGETAYVQMGVLSDTGSTICDADLQLMITDPFGNTKEVAVERSGLCNGNNVVDVPDYVSNVEITNTGVYDLELIHFDDKGRILHNIVDSFEVRDSVSFDVEREGPTRIYPPVPYDVSITVRPTQGFAGEVIETLPYGFVVEETNADSVIETESGVQLRWSHELGGGESALLSYTFDAPDISPYLYTTGPLQIREDGMLAFEELREWQIASDATGNMLIFWEGATVPTGWSCVSCTTGDPFFEQFIMASSTYGTTGGSIDHTHTKTDSLQTAAGGTTESKSGTGVSVTSHTHTFASIIGTGSNLPSYRQLRVLRYDTAGAPSQLPTGAIVVFDTSVPAGWTQLSAQDTYYVRGESTTGATGGSNAHLHTISGTTGAAAGGDVSPRGGGAADGAASGHTHTVSSSTGSDDQQPPYIEVIFASLDATSTPPTGMISMWTDTPPAGWLSVSDAGEDLADRFIKGSSTYGVVGGGVNHSHSDVTGISTTQTGTIVTNVRPGSAGSDATHIHTVDVTDFSTEDNYPPYITAIFAKNQGAATPVFTQNYFRWYDNVDSQTPTDPWPIGVTDLTENSNITSTSTPVKPGDELRLRMSVNVTNATTTATATAFKLQYAKQDTFCSAVTEGGWFDVGKIASTTPWVGFNNASVSDGSMLSSTTLSVTDVAQTYEEENPTAATPNTIDPGQDAEWDWVLSNNNASSTAEYCFRMVEDDGSVFNSYTRYPTLQTNHAPGTPTLTKLFDNEKVASTSPWFEFSAIDDEGERVHYQVQVATDYNFGSTIIDKNSDDNDNLFKNLNDNLDKPPFVHNNTIRFKSATALTDSTTYYWRVRAVDPNGSNEYGKWSEKRSFTVDTTVGITTWFQTMQEQFDSNTLVGTDALGTDEVALATGSSTGSMYSNSIDFDWTDIGTIWGDFLFNDTEGTGDITYYVEYFTSTSSWARVPDTALSGNSTGFDVSPISLTGLDTDTHNVIRVRADLDEVVSGNPTLQDWTVKWGTRVETPTLTKLFDNEKTGTTTPTFEFSTTDPDGDDLRYQISWSTEYNFTSSTTKTSNTDTGFVDTTSGDADPFTSGDTIEFTVQSADALINNETYWWRVRAIDPNGENAWSQWSDRQSFTVDTVITSSTWYQTTSEQFDTDTLAGLHTIPNNFVTVATTTGDAMIAYGEGSVQTPRYRLWNGETKSWNSEDGALSVGAQINWVVLEAGISRDEYALATLGTDADVNVQIYSDGAWGDLQELTAAIGNTGARGVDLAYETTSGDLLAVSCDGDSNPTYYTWDGSSWSGSGTVTTTGTDDCEWIQLASDPASGSDEIVMLMLNSSGSQYEALVWDGSTWGNSTTQGSMSETGHEGMAIEYEESGDQAVIVTSSGNSPNIAWSAWNGTTWSASASMNVGGLEFGTLKRDEGTDNMVLCSVDDGTNINALEWNGTGWGTSQELDATANSKDDRPIDCEYEVTTGRDGYIMAAYSDATNARYQAYDGATWSAEGSVSTITDSDTVQLRRTGDGTILGVFLDGPNTQYDFSYWIASTTSWSTAETLEDTPSVTLAPYKEPFMIAPQNPQSSGVLLSSPIDFDDGLGPFWDQVSWNDTTSGSSDILYQVQYYDTASNTWKLVPDSFIPDNSVGTSTSPIDLSNLSITTHNQIRLRSSFSCVAGTCPELSDWTVRWAEGITVSGTAQQYDQTTDVTSGTVAVAVNGSLQSGKTGTISGGTWSIPNVTVFSGDVVTVFVSGADDTNEAVAVAKYDGTLSITGIELFERHLSIGSDDDQTITNTDLGQYDASVSGSDDIFHDVLDATNDLYATSTGSQNDVRIYVQAGDVYRPDSSSSGGVETHDVEINGTLTADANTVRVGGSWDNNGTFNADASSLIFTATSTTETVDSTSATTSSFFNITFGETSGTATWNLVTDIDVNGDATLSYGTVNLSSSDATFAGDLTIDTNGAFARGTGTTTFDGSSSAMWTDNTTAKQDLGTVVIDGSLKSLQLGSDVKAGDLTIGSDDALDATANNYNLELTGDFTNNNSFVPRQSEVLFSATSTGQTITIGGSSFYDLSFNGSGGEWTVQDTDMDIGNNLTVTNGTVIMPTGITTISGSLSNNGSFSHTIGTVRFNSNTTGETIDPGSSSFYDLDFDNGSGEWTFIANATSTNDFTITSGSVVLPSTRLSVGGSYINDDLFTAESGEVLMYSTLTGEAITAGGSSFYDLTFDGVGGEWTFQDTSATIGNDLTILNGEVILPTSVTTISGSLSNSDTFTHTIGEVLFNSATTSKTVDPGSSVFYNVTFNNSSGGWTITDNATSTNDWTLQDATAFSTASKIEVQGVFTNSLDGTVTDWNGSTLYLNSGTAYEANAKLAIEERYDTLEVGANTDISIWNSSATTTVVDSTSSLYSQDHDALLGDLYIWGDYRVATGTEYWSYATDFDGADLSGGSERQVDVRFADGASATVESGASLDIVGTSTATTSVDSQSGTYSVVLSGATINAQYYSFRYLDTDGLQLLASTTVSSLDNGDYELALASDGGTLMTVSTSTLESNALLQINNVRFATSSGVTSGSNVTQRGGSTYWWFRETAGNFDGEGFDNDTGDPGTIRWDDSSLTITVSGVVYDNDKSTPLSSATCDGSTQVVRLVVDGGAPYTSSCSATSSAYSIPNVTYNGDVVLTVYLDNAPAGERATIVTRTPTGDITDMDMYANTVIVRHEDTAAIDISRMAVHDSSDDLDIPFTATSSLSVDPEYELYVWSGKTFTPGGNVVLRSGGSGADYDGSLHVDDSATFTAAGDQSHKIGGSWTLGTGATYTPANATVTFTATTTGKAITPQSSAFYNLVFNGLGGQWSIDGDTTVQTDMTVTAGTVVGSSDVVVQGGDITGDGDIAMTGGVVTVDGEGSIGGATDWQFAGLTLGDGTGIATTTKVGSNTIEVTGVLTVANQHILNAGSTTWNLSGGGTPFVVNGLFNEDTSTFRYTGTSNTSVLATDYYDLDLQASGAGSPTYTIQTGNLNIAQNLDIGDGTSAVSVDANASDPIIDIEGDVTIANSASFTASNLNETTIGGSWINTGTFTHGGGIVLFDSSNTGEVVSPGDSPFYNILFNNESGGWTVTENATSTNDWDIAEAATFIATTSSTVEVGGSFTNSVGGAPTTWSGSTLYINSGTTQAINATSSGADTYDTLRVGANTDVRMWNSSATTYNVDASGSLYSQDHSNNNGDVYIWGDYVRTSGADYWSYETDFDGSDISSAPRQVDVRLANSADVTVSGGSLYVTGSSTATTTIDVQSTGTYGLTINGGNINAQHYQIRGIDSNGLNLLGSSAISELSNGDFLLEVDSGSMMTVAGSVINANPLKTFSGMKFATSTGVTTGSNVTATGASVSSWRFTNHYGNFDGESFDDDPDGDPGYLVWDDSAATITISGYVYSDESKTVSGVCDGSTHVVRLKVAGAQDLTSSCNNSTGFYSISGVSYLPGDVLTVFLDGASGGEQAANVTVDPFTNIQMDLFENRVVVRHEDATPITISDLATYDSDQDTDIPFDADLGSPYTLTLPADTKLIIWNNKTFEPNGNVILNAGATGNDYDGTLSIRDGATFGAAGAQTHTIGGSWVASSTATFVPSGSTVTFTATTTGKVIRTSGSSFNNVIFNGSGGAWTMQDTNATTTGDMTIANGSVTVPSGTLAIGGSFDNTGGTFDSNGGEFRFFSTSAGETIESNGNDFGSLVFNGSGGAWTMQDTNATTTGDMTIANGSVTVPSGTLAIGGSFDNTGGTFDSNGGELAFYSSNGSETVTAGGSAFHKLSFDSATTTWVFQDINITAKSDVTIVNGSVNMPTGTTTLYGSFTNSGGSFSHPIGALSFIATTTGKTLEVGTSTMFVVSFNSASGGWTVNGSATSTNDWSIQNANDFTVSSGSAIEVYGDFTNNVGGTATTWGGTTLRILTGDTYSINTKSDSGDEYDALYVGPNTDLSSWHSVATSTTVASSSSFYSQDHGNNDGDLYIWGDYRVATGTEYWSYATDFDGTDLSGGSERQVDVRIANGATTTFSGDGLEIIGEEVLPTTIDNQGAGAYAISLTAGELNARYYQFRNMNQDGLAISGSPSVVSLDDGDFELSIDGGSMITLNTSVIDQNPSKTISNVAFATSSGVSSGYNVERVGSSTNAWTFTSHTGNYDGESFDLDGVVACGQVRWDDSSCLFVSQENYRWRNDDAGEAVPASEWFDADWSKRQRIRVTETSGSSLSDFQVKVDIPYDADMQSNFGDLRFTDGSGTTTVDYWIESYTTSATATVWVKVPTIAANDHADVYMYYDNVGTVSTNGVATSTFVFFDDFEDGDISEYSGDTSLFEADTSFPYEGTYGLGATDGNENQETTDGIYRTGSGSTVSEGETIRFFQYIDTVAGANDEPCALFGVQSPGSDNNNYAVCLEPYDSEIAIAENVSSRNESGTILSTKNVSFSTGWYETEIDWLASSNDINVTIYDDTGAVFATTSATSSTYSSGGIGFSFFSQYGGWDYVTSREYVASDPTYTFGLEQTNSGATWKAAEDTALVNQVEGENIRLRFTVQNTGSALTDKSFRLQYASRDAYPNCLAVPYDNYQDVPTTSGGCGTASVCMTGSSNISDQASTTRLLSIPDGLTYRAGQIMEDPSNETSAIDVPQNHFTEVEYNFQTTAYATSSYYCLRTTDGGSSLANYSVMAELKTLQAPNILTFRLNAENPIALTENSTTTVYATGTVRDLNGWEDLTYATSTIYKSSLTNNCTGDPNNCYQIASSSCLFDAGSCSGNTCEFSCTADMYFFADPTDGSPGESWLPQVTIYDLDGNKDTSSGLGVDVETLRALRLINSGIDYGTLSVGSSTESSATTTVKNSGNIPIDVSLDGTDLSSSGGTIDVDQQRYATSSFSYSSCLICAFLTGTSTSLEVDLPKPTSTSTPIIDDVYWGIEIPTNTAGLPHSGTNTFTPVDD